MGVIIRCFYRKVVFLKFEGVIYENKKVSENLKNNNDVKEFRKCFYTKHLIDVIDKTKLVSLVVLKLGDFYFYKQQGSSIFV